MRFAIMNGLPYLISNGRAIPVSIKAGNVTFDDSQSSVTEERGRYALLEVIAKCGDNISSIPKKPRAKKVDEE